MIAPSATEDRAGARRRAAALPPDERRSMIVEATRRLLLEHGEMASTRQIADAAGIAEGTIFRAFPDKDALIEAVIEAAFDPTPLDEGIAAIDPALSFEAALRAMVELVQRRAFDLWRISSSVGSRFHDTTRKTMSVSEPMVAYLKAHRDHLSISPTEAAQLLRGLTLSLSHPSLAETPVAPKRIVDLFLHGAGVHSC